MSDTVQIPTEQATVPPTEVKTEPKVEDFVYRYQPKDEAGNPIGREQVIKAKDAQEALDRIAANHMESIRGYQKLRKEQFLGVKQDAPPEDLERNVEVVEFAAKPLSAAEKMQLAQDITSPDRIDQAVDKLSMALFGQPAEKVRKTLKVGVEDASVMRSHAEATAFRELHPEFNPTPENIQTLIGAMQKDNLRPTKENFEKVFKRLQEAQLLQEATEVAEANSTEAAQSRDEQASPIAVTESSQQKRPVKTSSGLKGNSSPTGGVGSSRPKSYTQAEINKMSSKQYEELILRPMAQAEAKKLGRSSI